MSEAERDDETATTRVSQKGQTTIPKEIRRQLGIEPGDTVEWERDGETVRIRRESEPTTKGVAFDSSVSEDDREEWVENANERLKRKRETEWDGTESEA